MSAMWLSCTYAPFFTLHSALKISRRCIHVTGPLRILYDVVAGSGYKRAALRAAVRFLGGYNARFWVRGPRIWAGTNGRRVGVLSSSGYKSTQSLAGLPPNCNHTCGSGRVLHGTTVVFIENSARMWSCTIPGYALIQKY